MNPRPRAIVLGATGLVGSQLLRQLLDDPRCASVVALGRRRTGVEHPKLEELVIDFDAPEQWRAELKGDILFSALGTTLKRAGSTAAQHKVDYTYQLRVAEVCARQGVSTYVLISAKGASPQSLLFYSRMKGELERDVTALDFSRICILRPGLLEGDRPEHRPAESFAVATLRHLPSWEGLASVRPIPAETVARAAIQIAFSLPKPPDGRPSLVPGGLIPEIYEPRDLFRRGA